jgi:hypothetical protein
VALKLVEAILWEEEEEEAFISETALENKTKAKITFYCAKLNSNAHLPTY